VDDLGQGKLRNDGDGLAVHGHNTWRRKTLLFGTP
jgi:hypothetical protein